MALLSAYHRHVEITTTSKNNQNYLSIKPIIPLNTKNTNIYEPINYPALLEVLYPHLYIHDVLQLAMVSKTIYATLQQTNFKIIEDEQKMNEDCIAYACPCGHDRFANTSHTSEILEYICRYGKIEYLKDNPCDCILSCNNLYRCVFLTTKHAVSIRVTLFTFILKHYTYCLNKESIKLMSQYGNKNIFNKLMEHRQINKFFLIPYLRKYNLFDRLEYCMQDCNFEELVDIFLTNSELKLIALKMAHRRNRPALEEHKEIILQWIFSEGIDDAIGKKSDLSNFGAICYYIDASVDLHPHKEVLKRLIVFLIAQPGAKSIITHLVDANLPLELKLLLVPTLYKYGKNMKDAHYLNTSKEMNILSIASALEVTERAAFVFLDHLTNNDLLRYVVKMQHDELRKVLIRRLSVNHVFEANPLYHKLKKDTNLFMLEHLEEYLAYHYYNVVHYIVDYCYSQYFGKNAKNNKKNKWCGFDTFTSFISYFLLIIQHEKFSVLDETTLIKFMKMTADHARMTDEILKHPYFQSFV